MPFELQLGTGETVSLHSLIQTHTYEGLMEGLPTVEMNRGIMEAAVSEASKRWRDRPYLILPAETPIAIERDYPFGTPSKIPGIQCLSRWRSGFESRGDRDGWFELTVISYQDEFALPLDPKVIEAMAGINWEEQATFHDF